MKILMLLILICISSCDFQVIEVKPKTVKEETSTEDSIEYSFNNLEDGELTEVDPVNWEILESSEDENESEPEAV